MASTNSSTELTNRDTSDVLPAAKFYFISKNLYYEKI